MFMNKKHRAFFISILLLFSILTVLTAPQIAKAEVNLEDEETKLYFVNSTVPPILKTENLIKKLIKGNISELVGLTDFEIPELSTEIPTEKEPFYFPPTISNRKYKSETLNWILLWTIYDLIDTVGEEDSLSTALISEITGFSSQEIKDMKQAAEQTGKTPLEFLTTLLSSYMGVKIDPTIFHPLKMKEKYTVKGNHELKNSITFDLFLSTRFTSKVTSTANKFVDLSRFIDTVNAEVLVNGEEKGKNSIPITPKLLKGEKSLVSIDVPINENIVIQEGDKLEFTVEIIPSEQKPEDYLIKYVSNQISTDINITDGKDTLIDFLTETKSFVEESMINQSLIAKLQPIGEEINSAIDGILDIVTETEVDLGEINITNSVIRFVNSYLAASLVYSSSDYPSSVTIPFGIKKEEKRFYLRDNEKLSLDKPSEESEEKTVDLSKNDGRWVTGEMGRSKILKDAKAIIYLDHRDTTVLKKKIEIISDLYISGEDEPLVSSSKTLDKTFFKLFGKPSKVEFDFDIPEGTEIPYNKKLELRVRDANGTRYGLFGLRRSVDLVYNSMSQPSSLTVKLGETDHINIAEINSQKVGEFKDVQPIAAGEGTTFDFKVTSDYEESNLNVDIETFSDSDNWKVDVASEKISVPEDGSAIVPIVVNHTWKDLEAYDGDSIEITVEITGKTGIDSYDFTVKVSKDAVEYDTELITPDDKKIKKGESSVYIFKIRNKNSGLWPDSYTLDVTSEHDFKVVYNESIGELQNYEIDEDEAEFKVEVYVPRDTEVKKDVLTVEIVSESGKVFTANVTTKTVEPGVFEQIYEFFDSTAEELGLKKVLGGYAGGFLLFLIIFLIIIFALAAIMAAKKEYTRLICLDRIKETLPNEKVEYHISVQNPSNKRRRYELTARKVTETEGWNVSIDKEDVELYSKGEEVVKLTVEATDLVEEDDWVEVVLIAKEVDTGYSDKISTITSISDEEPELKIVGLFHWPRVFKEGDKVTTSFKLENKGNVAAKNISVILYVNGKEKNRVKNITIPGDGYAEIEIPWIAEKGKNDIDIEVKQ
ncbi:MAG: hypothetical protein V5A64_05475 [Candidatus Thermoplasmatota archaeon]